MNSYIQRCISNSWVKLSEVERDNLNNITHTLVFPVKAILKKVSIVLGTELVNEMSCGFTSGVHQHRFIVDSLSLHFLTLPITFILSPSLRKGKGPRTHWLSDCGGSTGGRGNHDPPPKA